MREHHKLLRQSQARRGAYAADSTRLAGQRAGLQDVTVARCKVERLMLSLGLRG